MRSLDQEKFDELFYQIDDLITELEVTPEIASHAVAAMCAHLGQTDGLVGMYVQKFKAANTKTTFDVSR